ncbi:MAG: VOC family protein [Immundisolibacterales bacterium]|nr:VOC family protein [Immundisolibacterales bacterium]
MPIKVLELHHHGIRIDPSDGAQESAREFYSDVLGLEADSGRPNIPGVPGFWMYVGDDEKRTQIHLMGATGESPVARSSEEDPTRPHVALAVEDIQEARRELETRGIRHWTIRGLVGDNSDQVFVPDPFNNIIELHQIGTCRCNRVTLEAQG